MNGRPMAISVNRMKPAVVPLDSTTRQVPHQSSVPLFPLRSPAQCCTLSGRISQLPPYLLGGGI